MVFVLENESGQLISPLHDIPLFHDKAKGVYNMVVEIPRWTNAKMEVSQSIERTFNFNTNMYMVAIAQERDQIIYISSGPN